MTGSSSADELKDSVHTPAAPGDWVQSIWSPIRSYWTGEKPRDSGTDHGHGPSALESELIDKMEREKITEYLQEKHRSNAQTKRK